MVKNWESCSRMWPSLKEKTKLQRALAEKDKERYAKEGFPIHGWLQKVRQSLGLKGKIKEKNFALQFYEDEKNAIGGRSGHCYLAARSKKCLATLDTRNYFTV